MIYSVHLYETYAIYSRKVNCIIFQNASMVNMKSIYKLKIFTTKFTIWGLAWNVNLKCMNLQNCSLLCNEEFVSESSFHNEILLLVIPLFIGNRAIIFFLFSFCWSSKLSSICDVSGRSFFSFYFFAKSSNVEFPSHIKSTWCVVFPLVQIFFLLKEKIHLYLKKDLAVQDPRGLF